MPSKSSIAIPVISLHSNDQMFPTSHSQSYWAKISFSSLYRYISGVMDPRSKRVQNCNKLFIILYLMIFLLQTLTIFMSMPGQYNSNLTALVSGWSDLMDLTSIIFSLHIVFKFRVAYVDRESRDLVYDPKRVALNYLCGHFIIDLLIVIVLITLFFFPVTIFLLPFLVLKLVFTVADLSPSAFVYESWLSKFVVNLLAFFLVSHVVGTSWYLLATMRVSECLENARSEICYEDHKLCEPSHIDEYIRRWMNNNNARACYGPKGFDYGIYERAVSLMEEDLAMRYIYSLFWGFQQISTLAGNQTPSFFGVEVLFTMFVSAAGLLLFSLLIGNIQNFLQALGRRKLEMSVRGMDVEQWMSHRRLPEELKRKIRESERHYWISTRGVNESMLIENLPEDLQRDIRRHLFKFGEKCPNIALMDECILDAIRERMKQKTYIEGSRILVRGDLIDKMVFIVQGKLESIGEGENVVSLSEGDVCGEELVTLCLEHYVLNRDGEKIRIPAQKLVSKRIVRCLTNVEAFTLRAGDLEEVFSFYSGLLIRNPLLQGAIKKKSVSRSKSF